MVLPTETLKASPAIDWVGRKEFDFTCKEVAEDRDLATIAGLSYKDKDGKIKHNPEREMIQDMDTLPWVADVYKRDLQIEKYFIGYLLHPYISMYTGRGCPAQCTFCLWPQTIGGHKYRVRSPQNVADEMAYMKKLFPQVQEFFFDDDTFTANLPRAREIAKKLGPLGVHWSCNSRANLDYDTIKSLQGQRPAPVPRRLRKRQRRHSHPHQKGRDDGRNAPVHQGLPSGRRGDSRHVHPRPAGGDADNPSRTRSILRRNSTCSACRFRWPRRIRARNFTNMAKHNGWFVKKDKTDLVEGDGFQQSTLEYPGLSKDEIFEKRRTVLSSLLPAPEADSAHHQDDAGGQGRLRPPLARRLRIFQEHGPATERSGGGEGRRRLRPGFDEPHPQHKPSTQKESVMETTEEKSVVKTKNAAASATKCEVCLSS